MTSSTKDEEMICALTADEQVTLHAGLRELPETMPPRDVWRRIHEQAQAEGLLKGASVRRRSLWYAGVGVAAAALLAAIMMPAQQNAGDGSQIVPDYAPAMTGDLSNLRTLQVQSRQLEQDLRSLPDAPKVASAGTVATLYELEDRITAIDYQLNDPEARLSAQDQEIFWRERVRLMKMLLQLRYAQAQRAAY